MVSADRKLIATKTSYLYNHSEQKSRMHNTPNIEVDGLQQETATLGPIHVRQEQESRTKMYKFALGEE